MFKQDWTTSSRKLSTTPHSIVNTTQLGGTMIIIKKSRNMHFPITVPYPVQGRFNSQYDLCWSLSVDLVNNGNTNLETDTLINRRYIENKKTEPNHTRKAYSKMFYCEWQHKRHDDSPSTRNPIRFCTRWELHRLSGMISEAIPSVPTWPHATEIDAATHCINFGAGSHDACRLCLPKTSQKSYIVAIYYPKMELTLSSPTAVCMRGHHRSSGVGTKEGRKEGRYVHANGTTDEDDLKSRKQKSCAAAPKAKPWATKLATRVGEPYPPPTTLNCSISVGYHLELTFYGVRVSFFTQIHKWLWVAL